ncbi:MAG: sugar phosphate isomerase/epimerase [Paenibacillaceae bacterium]|nr:sugar phosphate isomerase/epimerase [Paenibacillaceae bacterium]
MRLQNKIGIFTHSFRVGLQEGLKLAQQLGADGVQLLAIGGELDPHRMPASARVELKRHIAKLGLEVSALCGDLGGYGFQDKEANPDKIETSKRILDLAVDLGTNVVMTHIGPIPEDANDPVCREMHRACLELAAYAASKNAYFAIETGPETAERLKRFLDSLPTRGVAVNFDPANLVMVTGDDPVQGVKLLKDYIVHTHVKDGVRLREADPRTVYRTLGYRPPEQDETGLAAGPVYREVPLGEGAVRFDAYFAALQSIGYGGYLTIERETGERPAEDIGRAIAFINRFR